MELWEIVARERIRDTLGRYNWAGDSFRLDQLAGAFCPDGVLEVRGRPPVHGRPAIVAFLGGSDGDDDQRRAGARAAATAAGVRRVVRHHVTNVRFVELHHDLAHVECYFAVLTEVGLDHFGRYRDTLVPEADEWLIRHRFVSTDWHAPESTMRAPPGG